MSTMTRTIRDIAAFAAANSVSSAHVERLLARAAETGGAAPKRGTPTRASRKRWR